MAKLTLADVANLMGNPTSAANTINANNALVETALENTLSRDGTTPNQMEADIDMNNNDLLNVDALNVESLTIAGVPVLPEDGLLVSAPDVRNFLDTAPYVETRTILKALDTTKDTVAILKEAGREGIFKWTAGDYSAEIAADTAEGIYLKADAIAAASGAWVRIFDGAANVKWYGAAGDGVADDLAEINAAVASGLPLAWAPGTYRVTSTVTCTTAQTWIALGKVEIVYDAAGGSAVAPVLDFKERIDITGDFDIDHQADTKGFIPPTVYGGNVITGSAVLVQGDYSSVSEITVRNSWDNGIAVIKLSDVGVETAGSPKYWSITGTETVGCGTGEHAALTPGKIGAGIDVGSGSAGTVSDCVDFGSYLGFIVDLGAGAQVELDNCVSWFAKNDAANPTNGSGYGFYIGSGDCRVTNCTAVGSEYRGFWYDGTAQNCDFVNCMAYISEREGFWIKGGDATFTACRAKGCGTDTTNTYPAFWVDSSAGAIPSLSLIGCTTTGSDHKYGILFSGANTIDFKQIGGDFTGATSRYSGLDSYTTSQWVSRDGRWGNVDDPTLDVELQGTTTDWTATVVGDSGNNGGFVISDKANRNNRIAMGYDPTNNVGVVQAITAGTDKRQLLLNPSGGNVGLGAGSWTTGHSTMGSYHFWVDADGRLRSKSSAPASDTDGLAVGGARYSVTINDDAVYTIDFGATVTSLMFRFADNQGNGGNFAVRAASSPLIRAMGVTSGGSTVASVNTALTGTTGTDGNITIGCDATGKVYIENRSGSQRSFTAWVER